MIHWEGQKITAISAPLPGTPPADVDVLGARTKALLGLSLRRDGDPAPGSGHGYSNGLPAELDVALALPLQRDFERKFLNERQL